MKSEAHLQLEDARNVIDERVFKVLLECFKHDQLLSHRLQFPVTLREKREGVVVCSGMSCRGLKTNITQHTGK